MSKKNLISLLLVFLLGAMCGAAANYFYQMRQSDKTQPQLNAQQHKPPKFHPLKEMVISLSDHGDIRYFVVDFTLVTHSAQQIKEVELYQPVVRSALLRLLSHYSFSYLANPANEKNFRQAVLAELRRVMIQNTGQQQINDLLITKYLLE
ncbi:flagellar basal body-associated FliL family protein [Dongshaea marina]|uniref:flagellar basal body-associated FliL family protein n=1 Tax=Dongshaea marina TaxID=2047966 RepID=UPI000D3E1FDF|nr:flagellar basal body-associated FliL family protein [Dongshaea marina]